MNRRSIGLSFLLFFIIIFGASCGAPAQPAAAAGTPTASAASVAPTAAVSPTAILTSGWSLGGTIYWGKSPVPGARAELRRVDWRSNPDGDNFVAGTTADAEGRYEFRNPPAGRYSLVAVWPDGRDGAGGTPLVDIAAGQAITDMDLKLERPLKLLEPAAGAETSVSPTLRWEAFPGAQTYRVLVIDAGTTEALLQQEITATTIVVSPPLETGRTYDLAINALDGDQESLANAQAEFKVAGTAATPTPRAGWDDTLPPSCQPSVTPGTAVAVDPQRRYCYLYPARFTPAEFDNGGAGVLGPDIEGISPPLQAAMEIKVTPAPEGMRVKEYVEGILQMLNVAPASEFKREESAMGGEPAIIVWGVSRQGFTKDVFVFHDGQCWSFMYRPSALKYPQAADEVEELFRLTADSFTFMQ